MRKILLFPLLVSFLIAISTQAEAQDSNWMDDCIKSNQVYTYEINRSLTEMVRLLADIKGQSQNFSRSEKKSLKEAEDLMAKLSQLSMFNCDKITEQSWIEIRDDRISELIKAKSRIEPNLFKLNSLKGIEITCYKAGSTKIISGKNPKCPKGFKKLS
jgi:hypothetical protein